MSRLPWPGPKRQHGSATNPSGRSPGASPRRSEAIEGNRTSAGGVLPLNHVESLVQDRLGQATGTIKFRPD